MDEFDPRQELVERLVEYKKFKEIAYELSRRESHQRLHFVRQVPDLQLSERLGGDVTSGQISLFDLVAAFSESLKRIENEPVHQVFTPSLRVDDQINFILTFLKDQSQVSFSELMQHVHIQTRSALIATFLALLELIRNRKLMIKQKQPFSEIWIFNPQVNN
jgi:segregation and condensation protein A